MSLDAPTQRRAAIGIAIVLAAQLMLILDTTIVTVALPQIDEGLGFGTASLAWVINAYGLAYGAGLLVGGRLGDVYGRRRIFQVGLALFTVSSMVGGVAQTSGWLIAARAAQGLGAALTAPSVLALLTTSAPDEAARHRVLALFSAVGISGGAIGLLAGGVVTEYGSWRWTLLVNVPLGLGVLASVRRFVAETARRPEPFDLAGAALAAAGSIAVVWALIGAPDHGWTSTRTVLALAAGGTLVGLLALQERRAAFPLVAPALLRHRPRVGALLVTTMVFGGQFAMSFLGVQYVQRVLGLGPLATGAAFLPMTAGILAVSRVVPGLVARVGQRRLLIAGTIGLLTCFAWLSRADEHSGYWTAVFGPILLNGVAAGLTFMPAASLVVGGVAPAQAGAASGVLQTTQQLGGAIGLAVVASVYATGAVPGRFVPGLDVALLTCSGFAALGLLAAALIVPGRRATAAAARLQAAGATSSTSSWSTP